MASEYINFIITMVSELMVFVQNSSALDDEEDVMLMEFSGGIKMKKTRKFKFVNVKIDDFWSILIMEELSRLNDAQI